MVFNGFLVGFSGSDTASSHFWCSEYLVDLVIHCILYVFQMGFDGYLAIFMVFEILMVL